MILYRGISSTVFLYCSDLATMDENMYCKIIGRLKVWFFTSIGRKLPGQFQTIQLVYKCVSDSNTNPMEPACLSQSFRIRVINLFDVVFL